MHIGSTVGALCRVSSTDEEGWKSPLEASLPEGAGDVDPAPCGGYFSEHLGAQLRNSESCWRHFLHQSHTELLLVVLSGIDLGRAGQYSPHYRCHSGRRRCRDSRYHLSWQVNLFSHLATFYTPRRCKSPGLSGSFRCRKSS